MRKYPFPILDRCCTKDYNVPGTDLVIEKGTSVIVPLLGLHYDEQYFPEPEKYKPERFEQNVNEENLIYLPFGFGHKVCIGMYFYYVMNLFHLKFSTNIKWYN